MNFKRVLTMLLALCLILNMAVPGVSALTAGENEYVPGQNPTASEKSAKGEPVRVTTLKDAVQAQPKTQGNWSAEQVAVPEADLMGKAQLPQGVKELREAAGLYEASEVVPAFIVLEDDTLFSYKCDRLYCKEADRGLLFSDPALGIEWPDLGIEIKLSEKDIRNPLLRDIEPWEEK